MRASGFDRLHPSLQYHIVNTLGWSELREVQETAIEPILAGEDLLVLAQTAGGKTEAAVFPLLTRMLTDGWDGLSILYISPLRALLNNQAPRMERYFGLVGRRAAVWHGDIDRGDKDEVLRDPPDCLLTTPESLEGMLCSKRVEPKSLFGRLRAVVIDEVHAFAGDDRGWHLISVLSRLSVFAGNPIQRIGLSATVGDAERLASWLHACAEGSARVVAPGGLQLREAEVSLDFVGCIENAATVIRELHRGEKRLVFCDSRALVERLGTLLREDGVRTFVVHSSLARDLRREAERAISEERDCVVCATSALELGIDIGDLDRVIQIDSPGSVASFLQRMGRTGRRLGARGNCLFLATREESLLDCAALISLWERGFVEPVVPPPLPYHIFAQQVMALILQTRGLVWGDWEKWLAGVPAFRETSREVKEAIVSGMTSMGLLFNEGGVLSFGPEGESKFGRKHFLELLSVFTTPPQMTVLHGQAELGSIDLLPLMVQLTERQAQAGEPWLLTLAGRHWAIRHIDWTAHLVYVEPSDRPGRARWLGGGRLVSFAMAQAIRGVLVSHEASPRWSKRATSALQELRAEFEWVRAAPIVLRSNEDGSHALWTFAGTLANGAVANWLSESLGHPVSSTPLSIRVPDTGWRLEALHARIKETPVDFSARVTDEAITNLKFGTCLVSALGHELLAARQRDPAGVAFVRQANLHASTVTTG